MSQFDLQPVAVAVVEIVDAKRLWRERPDAMPSLVDAFEDSVEPLLERHGGQRLEATSAELVAGFARVLDAVEWALALIGQDDEQTEETSRLETSIGIDVGILSADTAALSGRAILRGEAIDQAARLAAHASPKQVALSATSFDLLDGLSEERAQALCRRADSSRAVATLGPEEPDDATDAAPSDHGPPPLEEMRAKLPSFSGAFIGRARELGELARLFAAGTRRVALCGAAGTGKSRLAVEFGRAWLERQSGRAGRDSLPQAWFCELREVDSLEAALLSVARTTGVQIPRSEAPDELESRLAAAFSERGPTLLILDDVEELYEKVRDCVDRWLEAAPALHVIVTSQRRLDAASDRVEVGLLGRQAARALLEDRLTQPAPTGGRRRSGDELRAVVADCGRLPLALELTAATLQQSTAPYLRQRAPADAANLAGEAASPTALAEALERSWQLLGDSAQRALEVCTIFDESFSTDAAVAVIEAATEPGSDAANLLTSLREHSLIRTERAVDDRERLVMLAPMRQFVAARISEDVFGSARREHLRYYSQWAIELREGLQNDRERLWIERGRLELTNLYRAVDFAKTADLEKAVPIIEALGELDTRVGPLGRFVARAEAVREHAEQAERPDLLLRALCVQGDVYAWTGQYEAAERDYRRGQALADTLEDSLMGAYMQSGLGFSLAMLGKEQSSQALVTEAAERVGDTDDFKSITILTSAAIVSRYRGDIDQAIDYLHRVLARARRRENTFSEASALFLLGATLRYDHQFEEGIRCLESAAELFRSIDDRRGHLVTYHELGECYNATDQIEKAERCYREAMQLSASIGDREYTAVFRLGRGRSRFSRGEYARAEEDLLEATIAVDQVGHIHLKLACLLYLGASYAALERASEATKYFERVEAILDETEVTREKPIYEVLYGYVDAARAREKLRAGDEEGARALVEQAYERAVEPGSTEGSTLHTAVDEAERLREFLDQRVEQGALPAGAYSQRSVLRLCRQMRWFAVDDDEPIDISRRGPIRRILRALAEQRLQAPGEPLNASELVDAGWPDEVLTPDSGSQRLYMTVSRMRSLGLKDIVETIDNGYLIAPSYTPLWVE